MELFFTTLLSIAKLFGLSVLGYFLFRLKPLHGFYRIFLIYTVDICLPVLIMDRIIFHLTPDLLGSLWYLMLICTALIAGGILCGMLLLRAFSVAKGKEHLFLAIMGFSNVGYLPLPLMQALFQGPGLIQAQIYIFFFIIPFNLLIWSLGVPLCLNERISFKKMRFTLTMPFISVVLSLILSFVITKETVPGTVRSVMGWIGSTVNPAIMIMLGGAFSRSDLSRIRWNRDISVILAAKLVLLPLLALPLIALSPFSPVLKTVLMVEFAVPPAVNLVIINKRYAGRESGENLDYLLSGLVTTYLFSILSIPFFVSILQRIGGV